jgi:hypothetical protein
MEAVDTDKKDRPKVSVKIDDCLVFVDPYKEVDEQVKIKIYQYKRQLSIEISFFLNIIVESRESKGRSRKKQFD